MVRLCAHTVTATLDFNFSFLREDAKKWGNYLDIMLRQIFNMSKISKRTISHQLFALLLRQRLISAVIPGF